jgi:Phage integrase family
VRDTSTCRTATWLTFRRTYASWAHEKGVPGKVIAQLMGHTNADVTINVYRRVLDASLRTAVDRIGGELFTIVHKPEVTALGHPPKAAARAERGLEI